MLVLSVVLAALAATVVGLIVFTRVQSWWIERRFPPIGSFVDVGGYNLHYVDLPASSSADLPPMVFVHGASGNLRDQMLAFKDRLSGRGRMIFVDRPGHGHSQRGKQQNSSPVNQAAAISLLLIQLDISKAILVGHSFGGAITAAFGVHHPGQLKGLVFLAPATHPWPGGVSWYYQLTAAPVAGYVFSELIALPAGLWRLKCAIDGVFSPNSPPGHYISDSGCELVLNPARFRNNAEDVVFLHENVSKLSPRYREIKAPTIIITGDADSIVLAHIHSKGLQRDIPGAKLIELKDMGHKPDFMATETAIEAIEEIARQ